MVIPGSLQFLTGASSDVPGGLTWRAPISGLDPLLAEAVVLLRASEWSGTGDWLNEGTAGSAGDAEQEATPTLVSGKIRMVGTDGAQGDQMLVPASAAQIGTGSATWALLFDPTEIAGDTPSGTYVYLEASSGAFGVDFNGLEIGDFNYPDPVVPGGLIGLALVLGDGTAPNIILADWAGWTAGRHLVVARLDATGDAELWVDGTLRASGDMSAFGAITSGDGNHLITSGNIGGASTTDNSVDWDAAVFWNRALTNTEISVDLPAALGV